MTSIRALVTGGGGFIGSNLVDALLARGDSVHIIDTFVTGKRENILQATTNGATVAEVDVCDAEKLTETVKAFQPDVIFHLAAQIDVRKSLTNPVFDATVNILGTINVLEAAKSCGVRRVVNTSTGGAIYGETELLPTPEGTPPRPKAAYGQSKYGAEGYCELYAQLHGLSTISLRYGNVYGPRQDPLGEAGVIAIFCGKLCNGEKPTIYGDGTQTRDYVYVEDVVRANLMAAESEVTGPVNIGTGKEASVLDLASALAALKPEIDFSPNFEPARLGEVQRSVLALERAHKELDWQPSVELADGLARTLSAI